jgi:hypothetical protein
MGSRRGRDFATLAAFAVAAIVLGVAGVSLIAPAGPEKAGSARLTDSPTAAAVRLDIGPVEPTAVDGCLTPGFAASPDTVEVLYAVQQRTRTGSAPVLVLRNEAGDLLLCDQYGPDSPAVSPLPRPTRVAPVVFLGNGRQDWDCTPGGALRGLGPTDCLAVGPGVRRVKVRIVVDGVPGPWHVAKSRNGYVHLAAWLEGPLPRRTRLAVDHRVLGAHGRQVSQDALPDRHPLAGCGGGPAMIG